MIVLVELEPLDPIAGERRTLRATSANDPRATDLNDLIWKPAISEEPSIAIRLFKGDFDGDAAPTGGSLSLQIDQFERDTIEPNVRRFVWAGAPIRMWAGNLGDAWPWEQVFEGSVSAFDAEGNQVRLQTKANQEPFEAEVLNVKYAGTGLIEGGTDLKDKPKPFLLGRCFNVEPVLINAVDNVYQVSGYGAIEDIPMLYERGSEYAAPLADYADYAALVAATITPGNWATCLAYGLFRLGAPAYGLITADVDGDNDGGTWWRKTGEIILRVADNANVDAGRIEDASFEAIDTDLAGLPNEGRIGVYITDQITVLDLAARLAAPCNAQVGVSLLGKLFASRISVGTPTLTLDAQQRQLPRVTSSVEQAVSPPYTLIEMGYARCWRTHSEDEMVLIDQLPTSQYPDDPPTNPIIGHIYIDATGHSYRFTGRQLTVDGDPLSVDGSPLLTSGYVDAQDQAAVSAYEAANAAIDAVAGLADDGIISVNEKVTKLIPEAARLAAKISVLSAAAGDLGVSDAVAVAANAAWLSFLGSLTPAWNNVTVDSPVSRAAYDAARELLDEELYNLDQAIKGSAAQRLELPPNKSFTANHLGVLDGSQLPTSLRFKRFNGTADVSTSTTWAVTAQTGITGVTVTVTDGVVNIPTGAAIALTASITVKSTRNSLDIYGTVAINRVDAPAPSTGGTGGGTLVWDNTLDPVTGTTKTSVSNILTVHTGASGDITFSGGLSIYAEEASPFGSFGAIARWRYRPISGSFSDVGGADLTEFSTADVTIDFEGIYMLSPGYIEVNDSITGLSANTDYEVELQMARDSASPAKSVYFAGTVYAEGS